MTCFHPLVAFWYKPEFQESRPGGLSRPVFIGEWQGAKYDYSVSLRVPVLARPCLQQYLLPCGKCDGCHMDRVQQWTFRALCELDKYDNSLFLTLTVDDSHIDSIFPGKKLCYRPFQLFLKRLRKRIGSFRFLMCGEYGTHTLRPHYHAILYGVWPNDVELVSFDSSKDYAVFRSDLVGSCWTDPVSGCSLGYHSIGLANESTIRYLVGYVLKKSPSGFPLGARPFIHASSRPALGLDFFMRYYKQLYSMDWKGDFPNQFVFLGDSRMKLPRYFDKRFRLLSDNVDYVSLLRYRASQVSLRGSSDISDLRRQEDFFAQVTKGSHNKRKNEV